MHRGSQAGKCCLQSTSRQYHYTPIQGQGRRGTRCRCCCWSAGAGLHHAGLHGAHAARRLRASSSSGRWRRQDPMTTPRRADARRGFLFASVRDPLPSHALQGWQGGTRCGMLDGMLLYNRPRRRGEVADFAAASGRRLYVFAAGVHPDAQDDPTSYRVVFCIYGRTQGARWVLRAGRAEQGAGTEALPRADVRGGWGGAYVI